MKAQVRAIGSVVGQTLGEFMHDECTRFAAAISYYLLFSLPSLAVVAQLVLHHFLDPATAETAVARAAAAWTSPEVADTVRRVMAGAEAPELAHPVSFAVGVAAAVFGASGGFLQFQAGLNRAWYVQPRGGGVRGFFWKRVVSFPLVLLLFGLLLVGFAVSAFLLSFGQPHLERLWGPLGSWLPIALDLVLFVGLVWGVVAVVFRLLPDAEIEWRDVALGSFVTAWLIWLGKMVVALYLSSSGPARAFGPAASLALALMWLYFTSAFLLLGAEFTQVLARRAGRGIRPSEGAEMTLGGRARLQRLGHPGQDLTHPPSRPPPSSRRAPERRRP